MKKKLINLMVILVMMLCFYVLTGCDSISLSDYKATKITELQAYASDKSANGNYCEDGLAAICDAVTSGKAAIGEATSKPAVTTAFNDAKDAIDAVEEEVMEAFYSLEEAFANDWLTHADLKNIAFYYRGNSEDGFVASPKIPAELSVSTESKIKQLYLSDLQKKVPEATLTDIRIAEYYGTYGNCVAVKVWDDCIDYDFSFIPEQLIGGVLFTNYCEREIYIYTTAK